MIDIFLANYGVLAGGLVVTLILSGTAIACGALLGLLLAFALRARSLPLRIVARVYRSFWRGTPILVQLLMIFYFLPAAGFRVDPMTAAILALTLNSAAFQAEIYRAGLAALPPRLGHRRHRTDAAQPADRRDQFPAAGGLSDRWRHVSSGKPRSRASRRGG